MVLRVSSAAAKRLLGVRTPPRLKVAPAPAVPMRRLAEEVLFSISTPPSVNALFKNRRGGRAKTAEYKAWIRHAGIEINAQLVGAILFGADLRMSIAVYPRNRRADISNLIKAVEDLCVRMGIIRDDSDVVDLHIIWLEEKIYLPDRPGVQVKIWKA